MSFLPSYPMLEPGPTATLALPPGIPSPAMPGDADWLDQLSAELDAVEVALERLEVGSFDSCEVCGARLGHEGLLEDPLLTRCATHS
ncbi:MAG: hypothetical protein JO337_09625 [Acidimicrobiales bacterium]|nr:hypothetical protein [Acidimicrobiales bacterium]